jgi:hypothetical protein
MNNYVDLPPEGGGGSGVSSLNGLTGALTLVGGSGITVTPSGSNITISSTGGGTVTSVGLADTSATPIFTVSGSPVTTSGTLDLTLSTQSANTLFAGPSSGGAAQPSFRTLVAADIPANLISNGMLAQAPADTIKGNNTGSTGNVTDLTVSQVNTLLGDILANGTVAFTGNQSLGSNRLTNVANPVSTQDAMTLNYATATYIPLADMGAVNGVATLDSGGHIPLSQLPSSLVEYQGTWNASTNTPTLSNSSGIYNVSGYFFIVSVAGTVNFGAGNISFQAGDWVLFNGSIWEKAAQSTAVQSVNGATGVVTVNAINQLTGDVTAGPASGSASAAATVASVGGSTASAVNTATVLVNTARSGNVFLASPSNGSSAAPTFRAIVSADVPTLNQNTTGTAANITASSNSTLTTLSALSLPATQLSGTLAAAQFPALTGDITTTAGSLATTLATVNSNVGSFGSSSSIPSFTVNGKGLITAASGNAVVAPAGTLTGTTLASNVVTSSLTALGTITTGTWNGTTIAIANGGTGNTTMAYTTLTDGATITWTVAGLINSAVVTLGGNRTLAFSGLTAGMTGTLVVKQDGSGSRTLTLPSGTTNKVINAGAGAVVLTTAASAIDVLTFTYDGTNVYWTYGNNYT